jgi:cell division protein ZapA
VKQIEVSILGQVYVLGCPPDGEALLRVAVVMVDKEMAAIREAGKVKARERIAVLAALNLAYQLADRAPNVVAGTTGADEQVAALVRRIDAALSDDGRLL